MAKITLSDLRPGYYAGMPPTNWWERWICHAEGCNTFHWIWLVKPVREDHKLHDFVTSESIDKGTAITRIADRPMMIWRLKGDPEVRSNAIINVHSEYGDLPYSMGMNIWSGICYLAQHYFGKVLPFIKFPGVNCVYWVDMASMQLGYDIVPGAHDYIMQLDLENSPALEYVGELNI
jgi:hypothetical protein